MCGCGCNGHARVQRARRSLVNNPISGSIPDSIGSLDKLLVLVLNFTGLQGTIPQSIGGMKRLTSLVINNTQARLQDSGGCTRRRMRKRQRWV